MIELAKATCPVLNVLRKAANIVSVKPEPKEKEATSSTNRFATPDLGGNYTSPLDTPGQKALKAYWRI